MSNNFDRQDDAEIQVFTPREILKGTAKKQKTTGFGVFKNRINNRESRIVVHNEKPYTRAVRKLWQELKKQIVCGALTAVLVVAVCLAVNLLDWRLGYEVIVDGENIGMVTDKTVVYQAIDSVGSQLREFLGEDSEYQKEPVFVRRVVSENKLSDIKALEDALLANIDTMVEGYAVYVDDNLLFGVSSQKTAEWVFAKYKQKYTTEEITEDMVVDFCESTKVKKEFMHIALLKTPEEAMTMLSEGNKEVVSYTIEKGDTLISIADKYNTSVEHLLALNKDISENIKEGMKIKVEESVPLLSVRSVQTVSLTETVPYEVKKIDDDSMYQGKSVVTQKGKEGTAKVLARVTKVNGVETHKDVLESETITKPIMQIEKVGTKERPPTTGSGTFINPSFGSLSSRYGYRWGRQHKGIDIAGTYNEDIKAADGGVVTYSGWMSGYGNYIIIDHENGYQTAYGHNASLCVNVGDRVSKGEVIAKMGNTGQSTGTHLHFEVRKNGKYVNPLDYVKY